MDRLFIYPLKSAKGVEVKHAFVRQTMQEKILNILFFHLLDILKKKKADRHGLFSPSLSIRDRQLLVVDRKGKFVTARRYLRRRRTFAGNTFLF